VAEELVAQALAPAGPPHQAAMSVKVTEAGITRGGEKIAASRSSRSSGTATTPVLGSMVVNG